MIIIYKGIFLKKQQISISFYTIKKLNSTAQTHFQGILCKFKPLHWEPCQIKAFREKESSHVKPYVQAHEVDMLSPCVNSESICILVALYQSPTPSGKSVFSSITAHTLCLRLLNKKKGSPSTILMMDWWMKDVCENSQHLFAPLSSQRAAPIPHA